MMQRRLVLAAWQQNKVRRRLSLLTAFLAAGLVATLASIGLGLGDQMAVEMKQYGANIVVEPLEQVAVPEFLKQDASQRAGLDVSQLARIKEIFWRHHIIAFAPILEGELQLNGQAIAVLGTYFDEPVPLDDEPDFRTGQKTLSPFWQVTGRWPETGQQEILVGTRLAQQQGFDIGQTLRLSPDIEVTVVGLLRNGQDDMKLVMPLQMAQTLFGLPGKMQKVAISALTKPEDALSKQAMRNLDDLDMEAYDRWFCSPYASSIAYQIEQGWPQVLVQPIWQVAASGGHMIQKIQTLMLLVTCVVLLAASMGMASLMRNNLFERQKEIGLMQALGASRFAIRSIFYIDALISSVLGGALGCALGMILAQWMIWHWFGALLGISWAVVPLVLLLSVGMAWSGTWYALRALSTMKPIEILYGQK